MNALTYAVDDWGRDDHFVRLAQPLFRLRWDSTIDGLEHVPERAAALLACAVNPMRIALALSRLVGRPVRFVGRSDYAPIGPLQRRLGGLLARPDEISGALAHGELVVLHQIEPRLVQPAVLGGHRVQAIVGHGPFHVGPPLRVASRRGPLAEVELCDTLRERLGEAHREGRG